MRFSRNALRKRLVYISVAALVVQLAVPYLAGTAFAVSIPFDWVMVRLDRMAQNTATTGTICAQVTATEASAGTDTTLRVVFPAGFAVSTTAALWAVNTTSNPAWPSGAVAWTGIALPTNSPSGQTVDFVSGNLANGSTSIFCFNWTNSAALTTKTTAANDLTGSVTTRSGTYPGTADVLSNNYALSVLGASGDTVNVTASVPPTFGVTIGSANMALGTLDPSTAVSTSANSVTVNTNAASGWVVYVKDSNFKTVTDAGSNPANEHGALKSPTAGNYVISNNTTSSLGTASHFACFTGGGCPTGSEDYGFAVTALTPGSGSVGTMTADAAYTSTANPTCTGASTCKLGVLDPTQYRPFVSSTGSSGGDAVSFVLRSNIVAVTPAATDYVDTLTLVAAGKF